MAVSLHINPPNGFSIDRLLMKYRDLTLNFDKTFGVKVGGQFWELPAIEARGARCAVAYNSRTLPDWPHELRMVGGEGIFCPNGVTLAEGARVMWIKKVAGYYL